MMGRAFTNYHLKNHSRICVIGYDILMKLFSRESPLQKVLQINGNNNKQYSCLVVGVMSSQSSNSEWFKPDQQIIVPDTFLSQMSNNWNSKPYEFDMTVQADSSIEDLSTKIKQYFHLKYGRSAMVNVDSDQVLVAQMRKFLNLFGMLLAGVAFI